MHYLIDGHNLIGKMPDIGLDDPHDEVELVLRLRGWAARTRGRRITLVFDHGLPGGVDKGLSTGKVKVLFASGGQTADSILIRRIQAIKNPREATLVTSDGRIIREAQKRRLITLKSEEFVEKLTQDKEKKTQNRAADDPSGGADRPLTDAELSMWLDLFEGPQDP